MIGLIRSGINALPQIWRALVVILQGEPQTEKSSMVETIRVPAGCQQGTSKRRRIIYFAKSDYKYVLIALSNKHLNKYPLLILIMNE